MMLKWVGACGVIGASTALGVKAADRIKGKTAFFEALSSFCRFIAEEIRFRACPFDEICRKASSFSQYDVLHIPAVKPDPAGKELLKKRLAFGKRYGLSDEEKKAVCAWIEGLGCSDREGQIDHNQQYAEQMKRFAERNREEEQNKCRLYCRIGVLCGVLLVVLVI